MQPSLAPGLAQGGERGHCKGNRERPVSRRKATHSRAERTGTTGPARTRAWGERGAASSRRSRQRSQLLGCTLGTGARFSSSRVVTQPQGSGEEGSAGADGHRLSLARPHPHPSSSAATSRTLSAKRPRGVQSKARVHPTSGASSHRFTVPRLQRRVPQEQAPQAPGLQTSVPRVQPASSVPKAGSAKTAQDPTRLSALRCGTQLGGGQHSPVLERGGGGGLAEPAAGTDSDLYRAVSRRSLKRSAAMRAFDSSCSGMLLMSEEKGLSGFSRLISQLVLPVGGLRSQRSTPSSPALHYPWAAPAVPCSALTGVHRTKVTRIQRDDHVRTQREDGI